MTDLSPAAQAVLNAYDNSPFDDDIGDRVAIAAALRAAADQRVELSVPFSMIDEWERVKGSCASFYAAAKWGYKQALKDQQAIADELKNNND